MDSPLNQFEDLLDKATLKQKREWLKVLVNKIQTEEQQEKRKNLDIDKYVNYVPNYVTSQDPLLDKLRKEMESLNLYSPSSNKPKTEWIGESEYGYGNTHFPPRPFDDSLSAHQELMQRINK